MSSPVVPRGPPLPPSGTVPLQLGGADPSNEAITRLMRGLLGRLQRSLEHGTPPLLDDLDEGHGHAAAGGGVSSSSSSSSSSTSSLSASRSASSRAASRAALLSPHNPRNPHMAAEEHLLRCAGPERALEDTLDVIRRTADDQLSLLARRHALHQWKLDRAKSQTTNLDQRFADGVRARVASTRLQTLMHRRRLEEKFSVATRRLQELLFECLGEIEKACRRSVHMASRLCQNIDSNLQGAMERHQWLQFLLRVDSDCLGALQFHDIDHSTSAKRQTFDTLAAECSDAVRRSSRRRGGRGAAAAGGGGGGGGESPERGNIRIRRIVCVTRNPHIPFRAARRAPQPQLSALCGTTGEWSDALNTLIAEARRGTGGAGGAGGGRGNGDDAASSSSASLSSSSSSRSLSRAQSRSALQDDSGADSQSSSSSSSSSLHRRPMPLYVEENNVIITFSVWRIQCVARLTFTLRNEHLHLAGT